MSNVTKLTSSNFLMWSRQVHALLDGYDLAGYIDGSVVVPSATLTTDKGVTPNPAFNAKIGWFTVPYLERLPPQSNLSSLLQLRRPRSGPH